MPVYVVTGKLGGGKTILSVKRILDKLSAGRVVATNLDLNLHKLVSPFNKSVRVMRIPDKPTIEDLEAIGQGTDSYDENNNGLLVLDECGTWFNSRSWNDKARAPVNSWFLHARKLGWDVILIIQHIDNLDSQARTAIAEHTVWCRRTDRLGIPFIGTFFKLLTGFRLKLPQSHIGRVVYGIAPTDLLVDRWATRGNYLYAAYDTKQCFTDDYPHGVHSLLPPWYTHGRYMSPRNWRFVMRVTHIFWRRFRAPLALGTGMLIGSSLAVAAVFAANYDPRPVPAPVVLAAQDPEQEKMIDHDPLLDRLAKMRITASWSIDGDFNYQLATVQSDPDAPRDAVTTRDLANMGYEIEPVSRCAAVIKRDNHHQAVYCF